MKTKPFVRNAFNLKNIVQEASMILINLLLIGLYNGVFSDNFIDGIGWFMIALCIMLVAQNLFFMIKDEIVALTNIYYQVKRFHHELNSKIKGRTRHKSSITNESRKRRRLNPAWG